MEIAPAIGLALIVIVVGLLIWRRVAPKNHSDGSSGGAGISDVHRGGLDGGDGGGGGD